MQSTKPLITNQGFFIIDLSIQKDLSPFAKPQSARVSIMEPMTFNQLSSFLLSQMTNFILYENKPQLEFIQEQLNQYHIPVEEWKKLLIPQAKLLGFKFWKKDSNLMLIPGYLYQFIPAGLELYSISGEKKQYESYTDLDNDCSFGCLAYGIYMEAQP